MVLCEVNEWLPEALLLIWVVTTLMAAIAIVGSSGLTFHFLYTTATYGKWQHKSSGVYPSAGYVRKEILQTLKGLVFACFFPALSVYRRASMQGYCIDHGITGEAPASSRDLMPSTNPESLVQKLGAASSAREPDLFESWGIGLDRETSWLRVGLEWLIIVLVTDFVEFFYHWCGHYFDHGWAVHRHHHVFSNPTPWAVIADEPMDNIVRASPLFWLPYFLPLNLNTLFLTFGIFFYFYGVYLHCGYEADWIIPSDHFFVNTSFQHYVHHAKGTRSKPIHCGFFIKLWDQLWGTEYKGVECFARTERAKGKRTLAKWESDVLQAFPNYDLLLDWRFFWYGEKHSMFQNRLFVDKRPSVPTVTSCSGSTPARSCTSSCNFEQNINRNIFTTADVRAEKVDAPTSTAMEVSADAVETAAKLERRIEYEEKNAAVRTTLITAQQSEMVGIAPSTTRANGALSPTSSSSVKLKYRVPAKKERTRDIDEDSTSSDGADAVSDSSSARDD
ncbi:unnamed protein product [Amoebophrya sp. A25]|nr:unnamed protein product [Amoebophrya sp. A25]|eukprot:GSA25T00013521001.1